MKKGENGMDTIELKGRARELVGNTYKRRLAEINTMVEIGADPEYFKEEKDRIIGNLIALGYDNWSDLDVTEFVNKHWASF